MTAAEIRKQRWSTAHVSLFARLATRAVAITIIMVAKHAMSYAAPPALRATALCGHYDAVHSSRGLQPELAARHDLRVDARSALQVSRSQPCQQSRERRRTCDETVSTLPLWVTRSPTSTALVVGCSPLGHPIRAAAGLRLAARPRVVVVRHVVVHV